MYEVQELRYRMAINYLEKIASAGFLTEEQLSLSKKMAKARFFPDAIQE